MEKTKYKTVVVIQMRKEDVLKQNNEIVEGDKQINMKAKPKVK